MNENEKKSNVSITLEDIELIEKLANLEITDGAYTIGAEEARALVRMIYATYNSVVYLHIESLKKNIQELQSKGIQCCTSPWYYGIFNPDPPCSK